MANSTTIEQEYEAQRQGIRALGARPAQDARARAENAMDVIYGLADRYGWDAVGPWRVHRPAFHGFGIISTDDSLRAAIRTLALCRCRCGCGGGSIARG